MSGMYNNDVLLAGSFGLRLEIRAWLAFHVSSAALSDGCDLNMLLALELSCDQGSDGWSGRLFGF